MKLSYGFRIVTRMFLGHFGDVESIFDGFSVSKRQYFTFWAFGIPVQNSLMWPLWGVGGQVITKSENTLFFSFKNEVDKLVQDCNEDVSESFWGC